MQFFNDMVTLFTRYNSFFLEGIRNTLIIAAFSVLIGTVLGTLMAMMRMSKIAPLRLFALGYIEFIRGTPLMVQLMFIFYGLPMIGVRFPDISFIPDFNRFAAGIVAMSINSCAYVAEIIRSGIQAVDTGQMEAARSIGYSQAQAYDLCGPASGDPEHPARSGQRIRGGDQGILHRIRDRHRRSDVPDQGRDRRHLPHHGEPRHRGDHILLHDLPGQPPDRLDGKEDGPWKGMNSFR